MVFEFEDDIEVSTDVIAGGARIGETVAEIESTTVNRRSDPGDTIEEIGDETHPEIRGTVRR